jgi:hypothetical protein
MQIHCKFFICKGLELRVESLSYLIEDIVCVFFLKDEEIIHSGFCKLELSVSEDVLYSIPCSMTTELQLNLLQGCALSINTSLIIEVLEDEHVIRVSKRYDLSGKVLIHEG